MARLEPHDVLIASTPGDLRAWLETNHASAAERWVGLRTRSNGLAGLTWPEVVDEVLCFGWIDSVRMPMEAGAAIRITPRRQRSIWSDRNVGRVEVLRAEGRMAAAGEAAFARRRHDRTGIYSFERDWTLSEEAEAGLRADPAGFAYWEAQPQTYRRAASYWIMSAKRPETRQRRLGKLVAGCGAKERLVEITGRPP